MQLHLQEITVTYQFSDSRFADQEVRSLAVSWMEAISDDELTDLLPQFVQVGVFTRLPCFLLTTLVSVSRELAMGPFSLLKCYYNTAEMLGALCENIV